MALISGVPPATTRVPRAAPHPLQATATGSSQSLAAVRAVQPVPATTRAATLSPQLYPPHAYAATQSRTVIEVDGIPFINDEAVLGDDIVRLEPLPKRAEPAPVAQEDLPALPQAALPPQEFAAVPVSGTAPPEPQFAAQAMPWPESLRILRDPPSADDSAA